MGLGSGANRLRVGGRADILRVGGRADILGTGSKRLGWGVGLQYVRVKWGQYCIVYQVPLVYFGAPLQAFSPFIDFLVPLGAFLYPQIFCSPPPNVHLPDVWSANAVLFHPAALTSLHSDALVCLDMIAAQCLFFDIIIFKS